MSVDDFVKVANVLSPIILAYIAYLGVRAARKVADVAIKVDTAAEKVAEVAEAARGSDLVQLQIKATGEAVHKLVNSERGTTLRLLMIAYQQAADRVDGTDVDRELYSQARKAYEDHMAGQAQVDTTLEI